MTFTRALRLDSGSAPASKRTTALPFASAVSLAATFPAFEIVKGGDGDRPGADSGNPTSLARMVAAPRLPRASEIARSRKCTVWVLLHRLRQRRSPSELDVERALKCRDDRFRQPCQGNALGHQRNVDAEAFRQPAQRAIKPIIECPSVHGPLLPSRQVLAPAVFSFHLFEKADVRRLFHDRKNR